MRQNLPEVQGYSDLLSLFPGGLYRECLTLKKACGGMVVEGFCAVPRCSLKGSFFSESALFSWMGLIIASLALRGYALPHCRFKLVLDGGHDSRVL